MEESSVAYDVDTPATAIESALELLEDYWKKFQSCQWSIEEKTAAADLDAELELFKEAEISYLKTRSILKEFLAVQQLSKQQNQFQKSEPSYDSNVKLPKSEVPKFDGTFSECIEFRDLFTFMVKYQKSLAGSQKLQYLKPVCSGEATEIMTNGYL